MTNTLIGIGQKLHPARSDSNIIACFDCGGTSRIFTLKIIPYGRFSIKYIPQIKESCGNCGRYVRFAPQTPELIGKFNELLKEVKVL